MKKTIIGLILALVTGILMYTSMTSTNEVFAIVLACILIPPAIWMKVMQSKESQRSERLIRNGLNHYRHHVHHRRLIKKTS